MEPGIKITQLRLLAEKHGRIKERAYKERKSWNRMSNELLDFALDNMEPAKGAGQVAQGVA